MVRTRFQSLLKRAGRPVEPDAELLRRYADTRDDAAFSELVRRYGRFVWGQCRSLLPSEADADDAFQATFLALAKSSNAIRSADRLGPWLHGVAYRVCQNAKRLAARRKKRERTAATSEACRPVPDSTWDSAVAAVHDELHQLSEALRVPFILCCLEGKGTTEAADQLGMKLGTFSARLTRAKQALLDRLSARGITAGVVALTAIIGGAANAPAQLVDRAVGLATAVGSVPANILSLTHGVLGMGTFNGKLLAAAVLVSCGLAAGFGGVFTANAQEPKKATQDMRDRELQELKRLVDDQRAQVEEARARADQAAQAEKAARVKEEVIRSKNKLAEQLEATVRAEEEAKLKRRVDEAKAKSSEFKYMGQFADFAPTPDELEKLVKQGEEGGYKFVGIMKMKGVLVQGGGGTPTLVFRKDAGTAKWLGAVEVQHDKAWKAQTDAALDKVVKAKDQVKEKLAEANKDKVKEEIRKAEAEATDVKKKMEAAVKDKVKEAHDLAVKTADKVKDKVVADDRAKRDEMTRTQAEIDMLRAKISELEGQTTKKPAVATVKFNRSDLGKGDAAAHVQFLIDLAKRKFDKANVEVTLDPRDNTIVVQGDPEVVRWLQDAVKVLGTSGKPK